MNRYVIALLVLFTMQNYTHAAQERTVSFTWNDKVKKRMLESLSKYEKLESVFPDNRGLQAYLELYDEISSNTKPSPSLINEAQLLLSDVVYNDEMQIELAHANRQAVALETKNAAEIEKKYANFRKELAQRLAANMKNEMGILCGPVTDDQSRMEFIRPLKDITPDQCKRLQQATVALYQIAPLVESQVASIIKKSQ